MKRISTKTTAEAVLRELPSVLGAYVSEDLEGHPREVHLLVRHGPDPAKLARDIRSLLEERLGLPIDQRVISIAQLSKQSEPEDAEDALTTETTEPAPEATRRGAGRPVFAGLESTVTSGQVRVSVRLEWRGEVAEGTAESVETVAGRARAAATATLRAAAEAADDGDLGLELDFASLVQALEGEYVLVSVLGLATRLGRRPLPLVGAHPVESDVESAAALATLKSINRVLSLALDRD